MASFCQLPDDIIERILQFTPPEDTLEVVLVSCRRLHELASHRLLWKRYCSESWKYWHARHDLGTKLKLRASEVDWKALYIERRGQNKLALRLLESVIRTRFFRLSRIREICHFGYDVKDLLLEQIHVHDGLPDVLARKYFSQAILDSIHRDRAIQEWINVRESHNSHDEFQLERSLAAFDMFVLHDQEGDIEEVSIILDNHATEFRATKPNWAELTIRQKALALNIWLRQQNLTGTGLDDFGNLRNSLIGQALRDDAHESNPNISSSIFCSLAARLGFTAECYMAPMMVHVIVSAPEGENLDGHRSEERDFMFLDPWGSDGEVPRQRLEELTGRFGLDIEDLIGTGSPIGVTERTANNIEVCSVRRLRQGATGNVARLLGGHDIVNLHLCLYAVKWARLLFAQPHSMAWNQRFVDLLRFMMLHWPEDEWLVSKYTATLPPMEVSQPATSQLESFRRDVQNADMTPPADYQSPILANQVSPLKIGQVFRHRRYRWLGVITGFYAVQPPRWEIFDAEGDSAQDHESKSKCYVRSLPSDGMDQPVVAAGNIEVITDESLVHLDMFPVAGRFFKRFDRASCRFIHNLEDEYPFL